MTRLQIRIPADLLERIDTAAQAAGLTRSAFVRWVLTRETNETRDQRGEV